MQEATEFALFGKPDVQITRAGIDNLPYASIRARMGRSGRVLMILGRYDNSDLHWISADNVAVATRGGRIVKTAGLVENLKDTLFVGADPVGAGLHRLDRPVSYWRTVDIDSGDRYGIRVYGTIQKIDTREIEILDRTFETGLYRETNVADLLGWEFENYYWADVKTGFIWKSVQYITPDLPPIEIEILKPAR